MPCEKCGGPTKLVSVIATKPDGNPCHHADLDECIHCHHRSPLRLKDEFRTMSALGADGEMVHTCHFCSKPIVAPGGAVVASA